MSKPLSTPPHSKSYAANLKSALKQMHIDPHQKQTRKVRIVTMPSVEERKQKTSQKRKIEVADSPAAAIDVTSSDESSATTTEASDSDSQQSGDENEVITPKEPKRKRRAKGDGATPLSIAAAKRRKEKQKVKAALHRGGVIVELRKELHKVAKEKEKKKAEENDIVMENAEPAEADTMDSESDSSIDAATILPSVDTSPSSHLRRSIIDLKKTVDSFTKTLDVHRLQNTRESFYIFRGRFESFLEFHKLRHVLDTSPTSLPPTELKIDAPLFAEQQRTVYHMLAQCVPQEILQAVRTSCAHTGYDAWKLLKDRFLGDEKLYVQRCEAALNTLTWNVNETFSAFESRATAQLAELELAAGDAKKDHEKQSIYMRAIRDGGRHQMDYIRLNNVNVIHTTKGSSFDIWLSGIREEARHIEDDAALRKQRSHSSSSNNNDQPSPQQISALDYQHRPTFSGNKFPCKQWMRSGGKFCSYGNNCRFMHDRSSRPASHPPFQRNFGNKFNNSGMKSEGPSADSLCWEWLATGRCRRGNTCRFKHNALQQQNGAAGTTTPSQAAQQQELNMTTAEFIHLPSDSAYIGQMDANSTLSHRII
ncbi:MAG TPA: zinc finger CCCH domain-containing protein, partial [Candidatus Babeliaceae bacterium]|nr:zinc finger CCCH domain-containing protein [Candidatus Babeliaceae bacterium]